MIKTILDFILYGLAIYILASFVLAIIDIVVKSPEERELNRILNSKRQRKKERDDVIRKRQIHKNLKS